MAFTRDGRVIALQDKLKVVKKVDGVNPGTTCKVIDFDDRGYPILQTKIGKVFVISAFLTQSYLATGVKKKA